MKENLQIKTDPKEIFSEYQQGNNYKSSIGTHGIFEQAKMNERFFVGDHWYGAKCGNDRPLVRQNVIKRIGEYKISSIGAAPVTVNYSAEGVESTSEIKKKSEDFRQNMISGEYRLNRQPDSTEISVITDALSRYQKTCAERLGFDTKMEQALRNAYISGTGIVYTYWDNEVNTGLFADMGKTTPIKGDIACEVLDVENVCFGDPNNDDVQSQPYILISQRMDVESVRREARRNGLPFEDIVPDGETTYNSGTRGEQEPTDSRRVTVITKLYKAWNKDDSTFKVMAIKTTEKALVRKSWDVGLTMYPIAKLCWERRRSCAYGDSEITYLIPNQIAINRMLTAECWSAIALGMPKLIVNSDIIGGGIKVTNDPGQVIRVAASPENGLDNVMRYVAPPAFASQYQNAINDLRQNTLSDSGANDAALGNVRPDNAAAIVQMREAALQPMQIYQNRYYSFIEEISRIWADFWLYKYGKRSLKIETREGTQYIPFDSKRYRNLVLTVRVDVGASTLWSEAATISTLDALLQAGIIDSVQYLSRLPKGIIPKLSELLDDMKKKTEAQGEAQGERDAIIKQFASEHPEEYSKFSQMKPEQQELMLRQIMGGENA